MRLRREPANSRTADSKTATRTPANMLLPNTAPHGSPRTSARILRVWNPTPTERDSPTMRAFCLSSPSCQDGSESLHEEHTHDYHEKPSGHGLGYGGENGDHLGQEGQPNEQCPRDVAHAPRRDPGEVYQGDSGRQIYRNGEYARYPGQQRPYAVRVQRSLHGAEVNRARPAPRDLLDYGSFVARLDCGYGAYDEEHHEQRPEIRVQNGAEAGPSGELREGEPGSVERSLKIVHAEQHRDSAARQNGYGHRQRLQSARSAQCQKRGYYHRSSSHRGASQRRRSHRSLAQPWLGLWAWRRRLSS